MSTEPSAPNRVRAGLESDLATTGFLVAALSREHPRIPREAVVVLGSDGAPRAYVNECRHVPIPLDGGSRQFFDLDRRSLMCGTHGALYSLDDGRCTRGPCRGDRLVALPVERDPDGALWVADPGPAAPARR